MMDLCSGNFLLSQIYVKFWPVTKQRGSIHKKELYYIEVFKNEVEIVSFGSNSVIEFKKSISWFVDWYAFNPVTWEAFGLVVWSGACLQNFKQSKSTAARRERIETLCPFILFLAFRTLRQEDHMGSGW